MQKKWQSQKGLYNKYYNIQTNSELYLLRITLLNKTLQDIFQTLPIETKHEIPKIYCWKQNNCNFLIGGEKLLKFSV